MSRIYPAIQNLGAEIVAMPGGKGRRRPAGIGDMGFPLRRLSGAVPGGARRIRHEEPASASPDQIGGIEYGYFVATKCRANSSR
jgi:hypothetical protein